MDVILMIILIISFLTDLIQRKVLNIITFPSMIAGFIYHTFTNGWDGFLFCLSGFLLGFALLFIPFLMGGMGAGDVKLLAAVGALKGPTFVFYTFFFTALIGGVIALLILVRKKKIWSLLKQIVFSLMIRDKTVSISQMTATNQSVSFPYGIAIVLGTFCAYLWGGFL